MQKRIPEFFHILQCVFLCKVILRFTMQNVISADVSMDIRLYGHVGLSLLPHLSGGRLEFFAGLS